jgi:hypothetical protein
MHSESDSSESALLQASKPTGQLGGSWQKKRAFLVVQFSHLATNFDVFHLLFYSTVVI